MLSEVSGDVPPGSVHVLEDLGVKKILGHLLLVPALAYHEQAVWSTVIMQEDEVLPCLPNGLLEARVALHLAEGLLGLCFGPIVESLCSHGICPDTQLCFPGCGGVLSQGPLHIVVESGIEFLADCVGGSRQAVLFATHGQSGQIAPTELPCVEGAHMTGGAEV